jgi:hypothetical protein
MIESTEVGTMRGYIAQKDESLSAALNYLWNLSKTLHDLQNEADGTENGREHVKEVEYNLWRLITKTDRLDEFNINELFVLSVAACCHDFGKALRKYGAGSFPRIFKHGSSSADFLQSNFDVLGLIEHKHLAEDASTIIKIHDLNGDEYSQAVKKLKRKGKAASSGTIRHRLLVALLKAADILHTDSSRTQKLGVDLSGLTDLQKSKYHARSCIAGWDQDGDRLIIQATVTTEEERNAIAACKEFMLKREWPAVSESLENYDFPHILDFDIRDLGKNGEPDMPPTDDQQTLRNIPVEPNRFLTTDVTDSALHTTIRRVERFPLCRHLASSHGAGAAVISLAILVMGDRLQGFKNTFKNAVSENFKEWEFTPRRLAEHIGWLADQDALISRILDDSPPAPSGESVENVLKKILENLPNVDARLYEPLRRIRRSLKLHVSQMRGRYKTIIREIRARYPTAEQQAQQMKSEAWENDIRSLFEAKWSALFTLYNDDIEDVVKAVDEMSDEINIDWERDVTQVWDAESLRHRPRQEKNQSA